MQIFRSEDELDMEGIRVTLTNGAQSSNGSDKLGVSLDSCMLTTMVLTDLPIVKRICIQKAKDFKAPLGWRLWGKGGKSKDVVSNLYEDEPSQKFEEVQYVKLNDNQELIGVYGYY